MPRGAPPAHVVSFGKRIPRYPGVLPVLHLDHFYYDKQFSLKTFRLRRSRRTLMASDHLPLVAEFELQT
jgi:endonuclease/exonuclease/phosphatase family metal-dependent hydrolase